MGKEHLRGSEINSLSGFARKVREKGIPALLREFKAVGSPYVLNRTPITFQDGRNITVEYILSAGFQKEPKTESSFQRPTICIMPGIFESVYSYMPTVQALEAENNVIVVNYSQFPDLQTQVQGTKKILEKLGVENVFFYGTSLGGLLMQHTALAIVSDPETNLRVDGLIGSHTVDINYRSLADPRYRALSIIPDEALWIGFNFSNVRRARRDLNGILPENATDDQILAHYFSYVTNDYKVQELATNKELARNYLNMFREAVTHTHRRGGRIINTDALMGIPKLDLYSDNDRVLKRHGEEGGLSGDNVERLRLEGDEGHYNHKFSQIRIVSEVGDFVAKH